VGSANLKKKKKKQTKLDLLIAGPDGLCGWEREHQGAGRETRKLSDRKNQFGRYRETEKDEPEERLCFYERIAA